MLLPSAAPATALASAPAPEPQPGHGPGPGPALAVVAEPLHRINQREKRISTAAFHGRTIMFILEKHFIEIPTTEPGARPLPAQPSKRVPEEVTEIPLWFPVDDPQV
ncbi:hypothetical protein QYE76_049332 [Lolium multiflorum]|uniref:Uncharacterized protein n=1 Tax=Lolium multiflorum TaxID=4521 RepID=A0AAD8SPX4_LOLMU|nr:hypothetical protein QYE76_049332 [Lolium multiflorum]